MKIRDIELTYLDVPFTPHTNEHMQYWLPHWHIVQICKLTLDNGVVGWGETIPNYTWAKVPDDIEEQIGGREAGDLLWEDGLGAGVQIAIFDAMGKSLNTPAYRLLGTKVREWCPLSWWAMDMPPNDWAQQCADAAEQGYMSSKLKARTWYDLHAAIQTIIEDVPSQFKLDLDFNATLANAANAVEFLKTLERYEQVAMIESPIPQGDVAGKQTDPPTYQPACGNALRFSPHPDHAAGRCSGWLCHRRRCTSLVETGDRLRRSEQTLLVATCRHRHHHNMGGSPRCRMRPSQVARDYLHEHLGEPTNHGTDRVTRRFLPCSRKAGHRRRS